MKFFCIDSNHLYFAKNIAGHFQKEVLASRVESFSDGEISCEIDNTVRGSDCFVVHSLYHDKDGLSINDRIMQLVFFIDALKRASAKSINLVIPYIGYSRQDRRNSKRQPISSKVVAKLISDKVDHIYTMDLHSDQIEGFFEIPVDNLSFKNIIFSEITKMKDTSNLMIVAPDMGSAHRVHSLAKTLKLPLSVIDKRRDKPNSISEMILIGDVKDKDVVLIDDLVDTGGTLRKAGDLLRHSGAKSIKVFATHPILSGRAFDNLFLNESPFQDIFFSNTVPIFCDLVHSKSGNSEMRKTNVSLHILDVSFCFSEAIEKTVLNQSVSSYIL